MARSKSQRKRNFGFTKVFLVLGALAFFLWITSESEQTVNDVLDSENHDFGDSDGVEIFESWPPGLGTTGVVVESDVTKKNYYLVFDGSGSMEGHRLETAKRAVVEFVRSVPQDANLGLFVFDNEGVSERVPLGLNRDAVMAAVEQVNAGGSTPLNDVIDEAYARLTEQGHRQLGYGEYHLVIVTDGEASEGQDPRVIVRQIAGRSPVLVHTIGFHLGADHSLNQVGRVLYVQASNEEELRRGLESVMAEAEEFDVMDFASSAAGE